MSDNIKLSEPDTIIAGDTIKWKKSFSDYKVSEGWELSYKIGGVADKTLDFGTEITASGDDFLISIPESTSTSWGNGEYWYRGQVSKGGEKFTVSDGTFKVTNVSKFYEAIAHTKKVLDAIDAVIEDRATKDQESYTIKGRSLSRTPLADLLTLKSTYTTKYNQLKKAEKLNKGQKGSRIIQTRFLS